MLHLFYKLYVMTLPNNCLRCEQVFLSWSSIDKADGRWKHVFFWTGTRSGCVGGDHHAWNGTIIGHLSASDLIFRGFDGHHHCRCRHHSSQCSSLLKM